MDLQASFRLQTRLYLVTVVYNTFPFLDGHIYWGSHWTVFQKKASQRAADGKPDGFLSSIDYVCQPALSLVLRVSESPNFSLNEDSPATK